MAKTRIGGVHHPQAFAVLPSQTVLEREVLAPLVSGHEGVVHILPVVGMRRVQPAEAESDFGCLPREFVPTPAYVITGAIRPGQPDHDRRVVSHMAETLFALAQRFFRT